MLSNSFQFAIKEELDRSNNFSSNDFLMIINGNNISVKYIYNENYSFSLDFPSEISNLRRSEKRSNALGLSSIEENISYQDYEFSGSRCPGSIARKELFQVEGRNKALSLVRNWLVDLWQELMLQPQFRKIEEIEAEIFNINEKYNKNTEDFFSKEEIEKIKVQLDELEKKFTDQLEENIEDKKILLEAISELHKEIEKLKAQSNILNKKQWFTSMTGKILKWMSKEENRKFLKDTKDFFKGFLPENTQSF